jgi:predicted nucleic acid-binding protein
MTADSLKPVLLDTSVWIAAFRGTQAKIVAECQALLNDDRVAVCGPVLMEINRGLRPPERKKVFPLLDALVRLTVDETAWDDAGNLDRSLRNQGITIPPMDLIIAQVCLYHRVPLFTLDTHFHSIPGLDLYEP